MGDEDNPGIAPERTYYARSHTIGASLKAEDLVEARAEEAALMYEHGCIDLYTCRQLSAMPTGLPNDGDHKTYHTSKPEIRDVCGQPWAMLPMDHKQHICFVNQTGAIVCIDRKDILEHATTYWGALKILLKNLQRQQQVLEQIQQQEEA